MQIIPLRMADSYHQPDVIALGRGSMFELEHFEPLFDLVSKAVHGLAMDALADNEKLTLAVMAQKRAKRCR